ncbi:MAG: hypothetical protein JSV00_09230 [bacterium]|nr:MAG: hypothetical protein JSV00_09230 [bacterium]
MLKEASISQMRSQGIPKERRILVNRGRGNDELAPSDALFAEFNATRERLESTLGKGTAESHNQAFLDMAYESRFRKQILGDPAALARLEEIGRRAEKEDLYLVCYEGPGKACHRRILMRLAEELYGARVVVEGVEPGA